MSSDIEEAIKELETARADLESAKIEESTARSNRCSAENRLNRAVKHLGELTDKLCPELRIGKKL